MLTTVNITNEIYYIGVNDRETYLFENLWPLDHGISYNAYLIADDKTAVFDTVKNTKTNVFIDKIDSILNDRPLDFLVINHMEPDHSGAIKALQDKYPNLKLVGNAKTFEILENFYGPLKNYHVVKDGDQLPLWQAYTLNFLFNTHGALA